MGMLRIISKRGDERLRWNGQDALAGDVEALAAIREAERIFARERARGATAFRVEPGKPVERLEQFDAQVSQLSWSHGWLGDEYGNTGGCFDSRSAALVALGVHQW